MQKGEQLLDTVRKILIIGMVVIMGGAIVFQNAFLLWTSLLVIAFSPFLEAAIEKYQWLMLKGEEQVSIDLTEGLGLFEHVKGQVLKIVAWNDLPETKQTYYNQKIEEYQEQVADKQKNIVELLLKGNQLDMEQIINAQGQPLELENNRTSEQKDQIPSNQDSEEEPQIPIMLREVHENDENNEKEEEEIEHD